MIFDLHIHSSASDGQLSPADVVALAQERHIDVMALSDHDTAAGVAEAQLAGAELGVKVIPAIELSADFSGELHILGYNIDTGHDAFSQFLLLQQRIRHERNIQMTQTLQKHGFNVAEDDFRAQALGAGENWGRSHIARALVAKGYASSVQEVFERWIGYGKVCYVPRQKTTPEDCIKLIHSCGGMAVLAHPGLIEIQDYQCFALIRALKQLGLDGIEAYYPQHNAKMASKFVQMAEQLELYVSYGSDYHGPARAGNNMLAGWDVHRPLTKVEPFLNRLMEG